MRVFLDANILFSASNPKWLTGLLLEVLAAEAELVTSEFALQEARRNLGSFSPDLIGGLEKWAARVRLVADAERSSAPEDLAEKDRPILDAAVAGKCSHLLTGDTKHFGAWMGKNMSGVKIVNQRAMADELRQFGMIE